MRLPENEPVDYDEAAMLAGMMRGDPVLREGLADLSPFYGRVATGLSFSEIIAEETDTVTELEAGPKLPIRHLRIV